MGVYSAEADIAAFISNMDMLNDASSEEFQETT
jgi:hypothetical protein